MSSEKKIDRYDLRSRRKTFLGLGKDDFLKGLFGTNAAASILILGLITVFLFKEGIGFFGQYSDNLQLYRESGLEYVEIMREEQDSFSALNRYLNSIRSEQSTMLSSQGKEFKEVKAILRQSEDFFYAFDDLLYPLREYVIETNELVMDSRDRFQEAIDMREHRQNLIDAGKEDEASKVVVESVDLDAVFGLVKSREGELFEINRKIVSGVTTLVENPPNLDDAALDAKLVRLRELSETFLAQIPEYETRLKEWDREKPIEFFEAVTAFLFGREWVTNSSIQDWYGLVPLFSGSLLVSIIAMSIAIPLGVGAAIYVNQVASPIEQNLIKPYIEFISAIPSVVIGFFGISIFGSFIRASSNWEVLAWLDFFPIAERLNSFTAGALLALMAIPTIFTLAEDSLNNVPKAYKEASMAMGATRLQTIIKIIVPTALSGIISAVLLGFGRVIGETMVVLLCAGNRISVPDFSEGLGAFFQPVHTMTGIIAQELGEVVHGSIHYRALFIVGMSLFVISLAINYFAQKIVLKYQISRG